MYINIYIRATTGYEYREKKKSTTNNAEMLICSERNREKIESLLRGSEDTTDIFLR